jgi:hypothetical protein
MGNQEFMGGDYLPNTVPTSDEKTMALLAHVLSLLFGFLAPLIIWLVKKDESPFVEAHAKEALNFQITLFICYLLAWILVIVLVGFLLLGILGLLHLILAIVATIKASEGKMYRYPFNFRLIK